MKLNSRQAVPWAALIILAATGCQQEPPRAPPSVEYTPFEQALMLGEVHALANGAAYLTSHRGVFYVSEGVAEKVTGLPTDTFGEVTALADGTALYLLSLNNPPKLFWLHGGTADVVNEGNISARTQPLGTPERFLIAENQRLKRELEEVEIDLAATQELQYDKPYYERERY